MVMPEDWNRWFEELERGLAEDGGRESGTGHERGTGPASGSATDREEGEELRSIFIEERQMEYRPYTITQVADGPEGLRRITLDGSIEFEPGQFVFLWLPGVGEKPFSVALSDPLTFLVRPRGPMTEVLCALRPGESLYVRGVYGRGAELSDGRHAWVLAGGTGLAVAPRLAAALEEEGKKVTTFAALSDGTDGTGRTDGIGVGNGGNGTERAGGPGGAGEGGHREESPQSALFEEELSASGSYRVIPDDGEIGRAVRVFSEEVVAAGPPEDQSLYVIGPFPFMHAAAEAGRRAGIDPSRIQLSIETKTRCGVGLCGECACAGRLTCREGTFFRLEELDRRGIRITECEDDH
jgi:dihydroorotate dehydrogenase (NAD+) catalytic subunit